MVELGTRVTKLERIVAPSQPARPASLFFLVWGSDARDIKEAVRRCVDGGQIDVDTPVTGLPWPHTEIAPGPRWTDLTQLSDLELDTLHDIVTKRTEEGART